MPDKQTIERARRDKRKGKSASAQAGEFVREEMHHVREGKHGARSTKQAIAIGLSKARRAGVSLPPPAKGTVSERTRRNARRAYQAGQRHERRRSRRRSRATERALKRESRSAASRKALSRQARSAARKRTAAERSAAARQAARTKAAEAVPSLPAKRRARGPAAAKGSRVPRIIKSIYERVKLVKDRDPPWLELIAGF